MGLHKFPLSSLPSRLCSLASEYKSKCCCVLQIHFIMHASADYAKVSLVSTINKITKAQRVAVLLVFDYPLKTRDRSKYPVIKFINHTHVLKTIDSSEPTFQAEDVGSWPGWLLVWAGCLFTHFSQARTWMGWHFQGAGTSPAGSSRAGEQRQTPCPALGDRDRQKLCCL